MSKSSELSKEITSGMSGTCLVKEMPNPEADHVLGVGLP
jgi:hypothetical protein